MKSTQRRHPKPIPFIATGAIIGFIVLSIVSWLGPNRNEAFNITYDAGAALGMMSVFGLFLGALVGAVFAAVFTYRR